MRPNDFGDNLVVLYSHLHGDSEHPSRGLLAAISVSFRVLPWLILFFIGSPAALAQGESSYPARPIRFLVGFAPGGFTDVMARAIAARLSESWSQQVVVDNRPGASTTIAADLA